jgi:glycolate dehydrogenase FAD-binding subunit
MTSSAISPSVTSRLAEIVGAANVASDFAQLAAYEIDRKLPAAAVRPASSEEVAAIVKFAAAEKLALVPTGARTKLGIGYAPSRYDLALDMTRLNKVIAYDPGDLTLSVEAGVPLAKLAQVLAEHRQFLPLPVPFVNRTTIGGLIASGVDSPLRQFYGTARDFLLGMEYVTGEGVAAKSGGRVVKNVTGYDIHKLMIGALGTLGIITKINFKTFPTPLERRGYVPRFRSADQALDLCHRLMQSPLAPLSVEVFSPQVTELFESAAALRMAEAPLPKHVFDSNEWAVSVTYAGSQTVLARFVADVARVAKPYDVRGLTMLTEENLPPIWNRQREFIPIALASSPATTIVKINVLPMRMKEALVAAQKAAESNNLRWAAMARGLGIIYFAILPSDHTEECRQRVATATAAIQETCAKLAGHATIPWAPAEWKSTLQIWGPQRPDAAQMQKVKSVFDPQNILSPGRFASNW